MAFTKPTGDQISFRSANTGTHTLDNYLEACEKGGFTLSALMDNLFTDQGGLNPSALQFRVSETDATNPVLQARFGIFTDPSVGWFDTNQKFFNQRGEFTAGTAYSRLDMVRSGSAVNICLTSHTSASVIDSTKFILFFDGAAILSEIQDFKTNSEPRLDFLEESVLLDIDVL
tara:strand:+ start:712 stop:1230 length:519 start_codon:yes stop_codon:yes gene_type:complete